MESVRSSSKMKAPKMRALNENVSPLQMEMDDQRERYLQSMTMSPRFPPFAENIDVGSPLTRYLFGGSPISRKVVTAGEIFTSPTIGSSKYRTAKSQQYSSNSSGNGRFDPRGRSVSPLSPIENLEMTPLVSPPPMYGTPVKGDEEVLVMDELVRSSSGGKNGRSSSSSGRSSSSSASSSPWRKSMFKTDVSRAWDESGNSHYNSKRQIARGKEDLHPTPPSMKSKSEGRSPWSAGSGIYCSSSNSSITVHDHQHTLAESELISQPASPVKLEPSPVKPEPHDILAPGNLNTSSDWSPLDDGIEVVLPNGSEDKAPSREEVDSYINSVLHGQTAKRRLPVFVILCEGTMISI